MARRCHALLPGALLLCLLSATGVPALAQSSAAKLRLIPTKTQVTFGKPLRIDIAVDTLKPDLNSLDLSPLQRNFAVVQTQPVETDAHTGTQHWRLRLYPRHSGTVAIPRLKFAGQVSQPVSIQVDPARDRPGGRPITVSSQISATRVWFNQPVRLEMQIDSDSRFVWLETGTGDNASVQVEKLPQTQSTQNLHGQPRTRYRVGWLIYPQTSGELSLQLPPVKYQLDGQVTHRFYPPRLQLRVRALPEFVAPTLPVGRVRIDATLPRQWLLAPHQLAFLTLHIHSTAPPGQAPTAILRQLHSGAGLNIYAPQPIAGSRDKHHPGVHTLNYRIAFATDRMGLISLPDLRVQYFDPTSGKLVTFFQPLGQVLSLSPWLVYLLLALMLALLLWLASKLYRRIRRYYRLCRAYRDAVLQLQQAQTAPALQAGLMAVAAAEGWAHNQTLASWEQQWRAHYPHLPQVSRSLQALQAHRYGGEPIALQVIREQLVAVFLQRLPLLRLTRLRNGAPADHPSQR